MPLLIYRIMNIITYSKPGDLCGNFPAGKLGNQAGGFPFEALGHTWRSSEHLYLLGYWSGPEEANIAIQEDVLSAPSGYAAKRFKKPKHIREARPDFKEWKHDWMTWVVWQKCLGNETFRNFLLATRDAEIIEVEKNDPTWAAWPGENGNYVGENGMGKVLMACREALRNNTAPSINTNLLNSSNVWILGQKVQF